MSTPTGKSADPGWDNRRLIMAAIAPKSTTRPARRGAPPTDPGSTPADDSTDTPTDNGPSLLSRTGGRIGAGARWAGGQFNKRVPPGRRMRTAFTTIGVIMVLMVALSVVRFLVSDSTPPTPTAIPQRTPTTSAPPSSENVSEVIITGITVKDECPKGHGEEYSPAQNLVDNNLNTAWICTRAQNKDGQHLLFDFGRQCTVSKVRADGGFDARIPDTPDGVDQWGKHRVVIDLEVYFPKELKRNPVVLHVNGVRKWQDVVIDPPATVSKLLIRVAKTADAQQSDTTDTDNTNSATQDVTTVAMSDVQFIGTCTTT